MNENNNSRAEYEYLLDRFQRCDTVPWTVVEPILRAAGKTQADLQRDVKRLRDRSGQPAIRTR